MVLIDTNVLVYAVDTRDNGKHQAARDTLDALPRERICVSTQVLCEYANVLTHPSKYALAPWDVIPRIMEIGSAWNTLLITPDTVVAALEAKERWQLAYYDAQIWATAALNGVPVVLSEDFADGLVLENVRFVDPFARGFDADTLAL